MSRAFLEHHLRRIWARRGPWACLLWPLSLVFGAVAALRRQSCRVGWRGSERLPVPVIVVGNVIAGGAGKTPVTLAVVAHLRARGWHPGIVSRGWGRTATDVRQVRTDSDPRDVGDEPLLLRQRSGVPTAVAQRRAEAARALLAAHPGIDILVCDDGLQHLALARDVEIVVFDGRGIGNGWLLPAGPLREPWPRGAQVGAASRASPLVLWTETPATAVAVPLPELIARRHLASEAVRSDGTTIPLSGLQGKPLVALAGIARPEAFFTMLEQTGLRLRQKIALPDHHDFDTLPSSIDARDTLLCTVKDAAKLWRLRADALAVPLLLEMPAAFLAALDERLDRLRGNAER